MLFDGVEELLTGLARDGHVMAVATAKGRQGLDRDLERTGLAALFETSRTVNESPSKPAPGMILDILEETGFDPSECLMIGDTRHDLEMAANAGVASVAVESGSGERQALLATPALACLSSVVELADWLASRRG